MKRESTYNNIKRRDQNHQSTGHREGSRDGVEQYALEHSREDDAAIYGQGTSASCFVLKTHDYEDLYIVVA